MRDRDVTRAIEPLQAPLPGMRIETGHVWGPLDLVGGLPCLDFANTAGGHTKVREVERIPTYADVIRWALYAELVTAEEGRALGAAARAKPKDGVARVREMQGFREALQRLVAATASGRDPEPADFAKVREIIAKSVAHAEIHRGDGTFVWSADAKSLGLGTVIARVALATHRMLSQEKPSQLRICERCTWVFIDRTKNQMRRFCRQDACGNKSRAERFYAKKRKGA